QQRGGEPQIILAGFARTHPHVARKEHDGPLHRADTEARLPVAQTLLVRGHLHPDRRGNGIALGARGAHAAKHGCFGKVTLRREIDAADKGGRWSRNQIRRECESSEAVQGTLHSNRASVSRGPWERRPAANATTKFTKRRQDTEK